VHKSAPVRLDSLEALRGIAALIVVLHHACGTMGLTKNYGHVLFGDIFEPGQLGVDIFFVLSGFLIYYTNPLDGLSWDGIRKFFLRRFFRIYPTYWLICLFHLPLVYLIPSSGAPDLSRDLPTALHSLLLLPYKTDPVLGPAWSLCFEVMFYAAFVVFLLNRRLGWILWAAWAAGCLALKLQGLEPGGYYLRQGLSELVALFLMGMGVAGWVRRQTTNSYAVWIALGTAIIGTHWYFEWIHGREAMVWRHLTCGAGAALLVYGLACLDILRSPRIPAFWAAMGLYSYSIYLLPRTGRAAHRRGYPALDHVRVASAGGDRQRRRRCAARTLL
jgi:exopolysaccharide production protein ExoZ